MVIGDSVSTDEGIDGRIEDFDGALALVRTADGHGVWMQTSQLMEGDPAAPTFDIAAQSDEQHEASLHTDATHHASPAAHADADSPLARAAAAVYDARRIIVWGWVLIILACMPLAATAEKAFSNGGFLIKGGEALRVIDQVREDFRMPITTITVMFPGTIPQAQAKIDQATPELYRTAHVLAVGKPRASTNGKQVAVDIHFDAVDDEVIGSVGPTEDALVKTGIDRSKLEVAGTPAVYLDQNAQTKADLAKAEMIGVPAALLVLLFVFGTLVAAAIPLVIGVASVIVTVALLHLLSLPLGLSIFTMNIASMLGFGLGIDYSLLGVSRFREELAAGRSVRDAVIATIVSSGRAAAISGLAVLCGLAALAAIPLGVMMSIAIGGIVVVAVTVLASLTLLPAALAMIGPRIERFAVRKQRPTSVDAIHESRWYRLTHAVMQRPALSIIIGLTILLILAKPLLGAQLSIPHDEVLPHDSPSLVAKRTLEHDFDERIVAPVLIVLDTANPVIVAQYVQRVRKVPHIVGASTVAVDRKNGATLVTATGDPETATGGFAARTMGERIQKLDPPKGVGVSVSGQAVGETEFLKVVMDNVPHTLLLVFISTFLIIGVAFRSFTLPIKAILLDTMSILASIGTVVLVFQDGVGIKLLGAEAMGYSDATIPIILFCVLFGLSMDYEVFMLAKVTELYQSGLDDREATARGVAATAPLVTGAALILIVIGISFALTELIVVKEIGFGMAVALALDATVVRILLLPATMRYLGAANWWMPRAFLRRIPRFNWAH